MVFNLQDRKAQSTPARLPTLRLSSLALLVLPAVQLWLNLSGAKARQQRAPLYYREVRHAPARVLSFLRDRGQPYGQYRRIDYPYSIAPCSDLPFAASGACRPCQRLSRRDRKGTLPDERVSPPTVSFATEPSPGQWACRTISHSNPASGHAIGLACLAHGMCLALRTQDLHRTFPDNAFYESKEGARLLCADH